ncbi:MAG TPA: S8 family peptidase [Chloroflexota bacterium]
MKASRSLALLVVLAVLWAPASAQAGQVEGKARTLHHVGGISAPLKREVRLLERRGQAARMVSVEVESTRDMAQAVRALGGTVEADIAGHLLTARIPAVRISVLARQEGVTQLYASERFHAALDRSVPEIRAPLAWDLHDQHGLPVRGAHVLVGIVDTGIDYHNPDFKRPDGSTRIKYLWDQTASDKPPSGYDFGYECDSASINNGQCPETDADGHGTHVAGIAAGNGLSSNPAREIGVAPEADIIVVKCNLDTDKVIAAWKYLIDKAKQLGEPIVINNSFGSQLEPHDGSDPTSQAIDLLSGPGRIFVASAGNEGNQGIHTSGTIAQGGTATIEVQTHGQIPWLQSSLFYPADDSVQATLTDVSTGETFGPVGVGQHIDQQLSQDGDTRVTVDGTAGDATYHSVYVDVERDREVTGLWRLSLTGTKIVDGGRYDAWLSEASDGLQTFSNPDESDTIASPADARRSIAVGNYATRVDWTDDRNQQHTICDYTPCAGGVQRLGDIAFHSSVGPTADGRQKPDVAAPGVLIISSRSQDASVCSGDSTGSCTPQILVAPGGADIFGTGTSMSAPHVTGTIALMLQVNPGLDPSMVDSTLRSTARHDQFTGTAAWTPAFGAGKLDAYSAVQAVMTASAAPTPSPTPTVTPTPVPAVTFQIASARVETSAGKPAKGVQVGNSVWLAMHVVFSSLPDKASIMAEWNVTRGSEAAGYKATRQSVSRADGRTLRWSWKFTPQQVGSYRFTARVTVNGQVKKKNASFVVRSK